jgi:hypothetical protein
MPPMKVRFHPCLPDERMLAHVRFRGAVERRAVTGMGAQRTSVLPVLDGCFPPSASSPTACAAAPTLSVSPTRIDRVQMILHLSDDNESAASKAAFGDKHGPFV